MPQPKNRYTEFTRPSSWSGMIRCRRDTVITFHSTIATPLATPASHTTTAEDVSPITVNVTASTPIAANRLMPGVSRAASRSATREPRNAPTAVPVMTAPNCQPSKSPSTSWTNSTISTNAIEESMFIPPSMNARVRSSRCRHSQMKPSDISARQRILPAVVWPLGRNWPDSATISTTPAVSRPAFRKNGSARATATSTPPSGGPTKLFIAVSAPQRRPLARSRLSLLTTEAISVCAELSRTTSQKPSSSASTQSRVSSRAALAGGEAVPAASASGCGSASWCTSTTAAKAAISATRTTSIEATSTRRS